MRAVARGLGQTSTCLAGEVELNGLDADVGGAGSHVCRFWGGGEEQRRRVLGKEGKFTPLV